MGNPARELATLLTQWRTLARGQGVYASRDMPSQTPDTWRTQVHAVGLLDEVDRFLAAMSAAGYDVAHYQEFFVAWARAVFVPDRHWGTGANNNENLYDTAPIAMLRATADLFDATELTVKLSAERTRTSVEAIDEIIAALSTEDVQLVGPERRYVFELLNSCRTVFQEADALGQIDLLRRVHELLGVLTMLADTLSQDPATAGLAKKILRLGRQVVPYMTFGAKAGAGALGAGADLLSITSGLG